MEYTELTNLVGNILDAPGKGGNVSVKTNNEIIIKSSGEDLKNPYSDCCVVSTETDKVLFGGFYKNGQFLKTLKTRRPSMEYSFHKIIPSKYVVHYHPVYVLPFLCSNANFDGEVVDYAHPGKSLSEEIKKCNFKSGIIYLKNHGVIIHADDIFEVKALYNTIKEKYFTQNDMSYTPDDHVDKFNPELWLFRNAIENIARKNNTTLLEIPKDSQQLLDNDEHEKYRMRETQE